MVAGEKGATLVIASDNDQQLDELLHLIPPPPSPGAHLPLRSTNVGPAV